MVALVLANEIDMNPRVAFIDRISSADCNCRSSIGFCRFRSDLIRTITRFKHLLVGIFSSCANNKVCALRQILNASALHRSFVSWSKFAFAETPGCYHLSATGTKKQHKKKNPDIPHSLPLKNKVGFYTENSDFKKTSGSIFNETENRLKTMHENGVQSWN